jgi:UDP-galactopyranose mutase
MNYDYVVVGAGIGGITIAERLATQLEKKVLIIEKRNHIGGLCFDYINEVGLLVNRYGPHTFHTDDPEIFNYILQFTEWNYYTHRVMTFVDGQFYPLPISIETINQFFKIQLNEDKFDEFMVKNEKFIHEKFFKNYTVKQWGIPSDQLDPMIKARLPYRKNYDTRYFTDKYQGNPIGGYTKMFQRMLDHPLISVVLETDYKTIIKDINYGALIYTGPIDYFYDFRFGKLLYRSTEFNFETHHIESYQPVASTRFPNDFDYTRITEFKKMTGQKSPYTTILKETPTFNGDPYYPYPTPEWKNMANAYLLLAKQEKNAYFLGRLAEYQYYDMDDVVFQALQLFNKIKQLK